jgi:hypothetical protein
MNGAPGWLTRERALALAGLLGLLAVGVACLVLIARAVGGGEDEDTVAATPTATPTATRTPRPTPTPTPTPVPLTPEQLVQRRAAADQLRQQGYEPVSLRAYHPDQTLRVLLGAPSAATRAAGVPKGRRAFFFVGDAFVDTDAQEVSTDLRIGRQTENTVTLRYGLDSGQRTSVRFRWDGTALAPQSPVPPADQRQQ